MSGATGAVFAVSSVLGPVLGGIICDRTTWRWIFLLNVPCGVLMVIIVLLSWPDSVDKRSLELHKVTLAQVDYIGTVLLMAMTVLLIVAMQEAGTATFAWGSSVIVGLLSASVLSLIGLIGWTVILESKREKFAVIPTFPIRFLRHRVISCAFL